MSFEPGQILLPVPPVAPLLPAWSAWLVAMLSGALLAWWLWRRAGQPLRRLRRDLRRGHIHPRQAAHALARQLSGEASGVPALARQALLLDLDDLRFRRSTPSQERVSELIARVEQLSGRRHRDA